MRFSLLGIDLGLLNLGHDLGVVEPACRVEDLNAADHSRVAVGVFTLDDDPSVGRLVNGMLLHRLLGPHLLHLHLRVHVQMMLAHLVHVVTLVLRLLAVVVRLLVVVHHLHGGPRVMVLRRLVRVAHALIRVVRGSVLRAAGCELFFFQLLLPVREGTLLVVGARATEVEFAQFRLVVATRLRGHERAARRVVEVHLVGLHSIMLKPSSAHRSVEAPPVATSIVLIGRASASVAATLANFLLGRLEPVMRMRVVLMHVRLAFVSTKLLGPLLLKSWGLIA